MSPIPQLPTRLCPRHGLVAGRDGRCIICHRDDDGRRDAGWARQVAGLVLAGAVLVGGVVYWKGSRRAPAVAAVVTSPAALPAAPPPDAEEQGAAAPYPDESRARARVADEAARQRAIEASMSRIPVKMYVVQKCEMCDVARTFLREKGVSFSEIDVSGPDGLETLHKLTPSTQVPVFDVDGEVLVGFGPTNVLGAVRRAAERRNPP